MNHPISRFLNRYRITWIIASHWNALQLRHPRLILNKRERQYARNVVR